MFTYEQLRIQLVKKNLKMFNLQKSLGISSKTINKLTKDEYVSLRVLDRICIHLECKIEDVITHVPPDEDIH